MIETILIHGGKREPLIEGALTSPIFQSSTYESAEWGKAKYIRFANTPNHEELQARLALLEGSEAALVTSSGMAAIATTMLTLLRPGDHLISHNSLYGCTYRLFEETLRPLGIETDYVDMTVEGLDLEALLRPATKAIYLEAISNPTLGIPDFDVVTAFSRRHSLSAVIDNTFATPVNFRPIEAGFDVVIHSASKYLNGHTDLVAGLLAGRADFVEECRQTMLKLGAALDPHAAFLLQRGLKTLAVRVRQQNESALAIARHLSGRQEVEAVRYPLLGAAAARANRYFQGGGGVVSFDLGTSDRALQFVHALRIATVAPSLGGCETLVMVPALLSHATLDPAVRRSMGVSDGLVRMAVGLESTADLMGDVDQALDRLGCAQVEFCDAQPSTA
ncbi:MAG TPA: PLP-dependent aspartate aminotransferase family protein [Sphingomicrobium sp.]